MLWTTKGDGPGYASPVVADLAGVRQVVTITDANLEGLSADKGELLWKLPFTTDYTQNAVTPVVSGDLVIYTGLEHAVKAVRIVKTGAGFAAQPVWENPEVASYMSSPVVTGNRVYGLSHRKKGQLFCLDALTGKTLWLSEGRQGENAALLAGGGALFVLTTDAELLVAKQDGAVVHRPEALHGRAEPHLGSSRRAGRWCRREGFGQPRLLEILEGAFPRPIKERRE